MEKTAITAANVIETEIDGMRALAQVLREEESVLALSVEEAVARLFSLKGRVILTGMGKSGHVARKIAATFASTDTPANYVHPAEASHGDLGMITKEDVVIALSNSGETAELRDVLGYTQRFHIPLIAMTSGADSTLATASDICLVLPPAAEACASTPAPTTSTTMMMALGDALALALLQKKGVTAEKFGAFHPGGKLGAGLKRVTDLMHHTQMPLCKSDLAVVDVVEIITSAGFGCAGVVDDNGALVGMVTDGDLRRHLARDFTKTRAEDIMTQNPQVVMPDSIAAEALALFSDRKITAVFIVDAQHRPQGLLHVHDCLDVGVV